MKDRLIEELDYTMEAKNLQTMAINYKNSPHVIIPKVIQNLSRN